MAFSGGSNSWGRGLFQEMDKQNSVNNTYWRLFVLIGIPATISLFLKLKLL